MNKALKVVAVLLLLLLIVSLLCGCTAENTPTLGAPSDTGMSFTCVAHYEGFNVVVDADTGVMYAVSMGFHNEGSFCMLVNADGSPKLYPDFGWKEDCLWTLGTN